MSTRHGRSLYAHHDLRRLGRLSHSEVRRLPTKERSGGRVSIVDLVADESVCFDSRRCDLDTRATISAEYESPASLVRHPVMGHYASSLRGDALRRD
jgi:hypothetical protein